MRAVLRVRPHLTRAGEEVIEVWYGGVFIATVAAADGPGVQVISKYRVHAMHGMASVSVSGDVPNVLTVEVIR